MLSSLLKINSAIYSLKNNLKCLCHIGNIGNIGVNEFKRYIYGYREIWKDRFTSRP